MGIFEITVNQMAFLFLLIVIGFVLVKTGAIKAEASVTLSKLENNLFSPALLLSLFAEQFTMDRLKSSGRLFLIGFCVVLIVIPCGRFLAKRCTKDPFIQKIFTYGLIFSNYGFMGNAVVLAIFPDYFLEYALFTLPMQIMTYAWGVPVLLIPAENVKRDWKSRLKPFANVMFLGMILGIIVGLLEIPLPLWMDSAVSAMAGCMSPIAMLLIGITVAGSDIKKLLKEKSIYMVTLLRLLVIPVIVIGILYLIQPAKTVILSFVCYAAMPLGLNAMVIPAAYGKDTSVAAGMAIISHILSCITIPIIFTVMSYLLLS